MHGLGLLLLAALWLQEAAPRATLPHVEQYEVVRPRRLPAPRTRRALPSHLGLYPESVSYVLGARGHTFTLHLRKNRDLVGSGYVETYTAADGSQVTEQLPRQDHCFYQGNVEGHQGSAASLSTCAGLRGFFQAGSTVHLIEPLDGGGEEGQHALYQAQHLQQKAGTCGVNDSSLEAILGPRVSAALRPRNWPVPRETRYVELFVVTDSTEFQRLGSREAVRQRVLEVVNHVDKLYQELNFRVVLVGLEMWNGGDKIHVSTQADATLSNFLSWRVRELAGRHLHDNAQFITGVDFAGTTVGLAKVSTMCSRDSGAVNQDHSPNPMGVASTMAHEMGHNLGMDHDENIQDCYCSVPRAGGGCVMAASIGSNFPRKFSHCSRADLETFVEKARTACLVDAPDPARLVGGPVCGNRFVERGEQCDCGVPQVQGRAPPPPSAFRPPTWGAGPHPQAGATVPDPRAPCARTATPPVLWHRNDWQGSWVGVTRPPEGRAWGRPSVQPAQTFAIAPAPQDCQNRCCNASTCLLAKGAECAHGTCCHECRVSLGFWGTAAGVGVWGPPVPAVSLALLNQVKPAGELCRPAKDQCDLREYCDGRQPVCPEDTFWENGTPCPGGYCYNGACPTLAQRCQDLWGPGARVATETCYSYSISTGCRSGIPLDFGRVNRCGTLFCEWGQKPPERSSCTLTSSSGDCQALVQDSSSAYEPVPEGTKCGKEQVCNHKDQCHCHPGWAPPYCAELLPNVRTASGSLLVGVLVPVVLLVPLALTLAGVVIYRKARSPVRRRCASSGLAERQRVCAEPAACLRCWRGRARSGPPAFTDTGAAKTAMGLSNPLFHEGHRTPVKGRAPAPTREPGLSSHPSQPPKPTASAVTPKWPPPAVVKPTCTPPMPPVKPRAGGAQPGPTQGVVGPKVALKPPDQRRLYPARSARAERAASTQRGRRPSPSDPAPVSRQRPRPSAAVSRQRPDHPPGSTVGAGTLGAARPSPPARPPLLPGALRGLYAWLDALPLSRRKRHLARDFSDGGEGGAAATTGAGGRGDRRGSRPQGRRLSAGSWRSLLRGRAQRSSLPASESPERDVPVVGTARQGPQPRKCPRSPGSLQNAEDPRGRA
eukprot:bmy_09755T0